MAHFRSRIADAAPTAPTAKLSVALINDQTLGITRSAYATAAAEKNARAAHASAIKRTLGPNVIVITDALNYIKGFRYQLYCESKEARTPSCVVRRRNPRPALARSMRIKGLEQVVGGMMGL